MSRSFSKKIHAVLVDVESHDVALQIPRDHLP